MNPDLRAALDAYTDVLREVRALNLYGAGASAEMTRLELAAGKAWQRCCILGATRADQDAAREASR